MTALTEFVLPLAVLISAAATSATAVFAYQLWRTTSTHDRVLFGDDDIAYPGVVHMVKSHGKAIKQEHNLATDDLYDDSD